MACSTKASNSASLRPATSCSLFGALAGAWPMAGRGGWLCRRNMRFYSATLARVGTGWLRGRERTGRSIATGPVRGRLRFAFYGRVSTEDHQDPVTSRARQRDQASTLIAGHGQIVAEYFDVGRSRALSWARRPQAAALLAEMADPGRGFDAIVIGEYERAFYGGQYAAMAPLLEHYGIQLWAPEVGGPTDFKADEHEQLMLTLGWQSKREITRTKIRVRAAMATEQGARRVGTAGAPPGIRPAQRTGSAVDVRPAAGRA